MKYKTVYEVVSDSLKKPTRLVSIDSVNNVKSYKALSENEVYVSPAHMKLLISRPHIAKIECFKTGMNNPLRERVIIHEDMDAKEFDKKLAELQKVQHGDIERAYRTSS